MGTGLGSEKTPLGRAGSCTCARRRREGYLYTCTFRKQGKLGPCPLSTCASDRPAWFGHAPGVEQFGEPIFWEDFLFFGHLAHGFA